MGKATQMCSFTFLYVALLCAITVEGNAVSLAPRRFLRGVLQEGDVHELSEGRPEDPTVGQRSVRVQLLVREVPEDGFHATEGLTVSVWAFDPWSHERAAQLGEIPVPLSTDTAADSGGVELNVPLNAPLPPHFRRAQQKGWLVYFLRVSQDSCCRYEYTGELDIDLNSGSVFTLEPELQQGGVCDLRAACSVRDSIALRAELRLVGDAPLGGFREAEGLTVTVWGYDSREWNEDGSTAVDPLKLTNATVPFSELNKVLRVWRESTAVEAVVSTSAPSNTFPVDLELTLPPTLQLISSQHLSLFLGAQATQSTSRVSFFGFQPFSIHDDATATQAVTLEVFIGPGSSDGSSAPASHATGESTHEVDDGPVEQLGSATAKPVVSSHEDDALNSHSTVSGIGVSINGELVVSGVPSGGAPEAGEPGSIDSKFVDELGVFELDRGYSVPDSPKDQLMSDEESGNVVVKDPPPSVETVDSALPAEAFATQNDTSNNEVTSVVDDVPYGLIEPSDSLPITTPVAPSAGVDESTSEYSVRVNLTLSELPPGGFYSGEGIVLELWVYNQRSLNTASTLVSSLTLTDKSMLVGDGDDLRRTLLVSGIELALEFNGSALPTWADGDITNDARFHVEISQPRECCRFSYYSRKFSLVSPNEAEYAPVEATLGRGSCPFKCVPPGAPRSKLPPPAAVKVSLHILDPPPGGFGADEGLVLSVWAQTEASESSLWPTSAVPFQLAETFVRPLVGGPSTTDNGIELRMPLGVDALPDALRAGVLERRARLWVTVGAPGCCRYDYFHSYGGSAQVNTWLEVPEATIVAQLKSNAPCDVEQLCLAPGLIGGSPTAVPPTTTTPQLANSTELLTPNEPGLAESSTANSTSMSDGATVAVGNNRTEGPLESVDGRRR